MDQAVWFETVQEVHQGGVLMPTAVAWLGAAPLRGRVPVTLLPECRHIRASSYTMTLVIMGLVRAMAIASSLVSALRIE